MEIAADVLAQRLGAQIDFVGLQIEGARAAAHGFKTLFRGVAVLAELFEPFTAGTHRVDLVLVVMTKGLEDGVEPGVLGLDDGLEAGEGTTFGLESLAARGCGGAFFGVTGQSALHLGAPFGQDAPAFGHAGHSHLELLAAKAHLRAPTLKSLPRGDGLLERRQQLQQLRLLGSHVGQPLVGRGDGGTDLFELRGQTPLLDGGPFHIGAGRGARRDVSVQGALRRRPRVAEPGKGDARVAQPCPGQLGGRRGLRGAPLPRPPLPPR